ncbi:hypothetical protein ACET3Z_027241 [Daucus carota]
MKSISFPAHKSIVWDSVYFVRIAQCGYEYEQSYVFWPLLPFCIFVLSKTVFASLVPLVGYRAVLGLSGYVLNNIAYVFAVVYFHRLSVIVLKYKRTALRASILFCFNPASIFFSSIYSESLYALLSIGGICHLMSGAKNKSTLWFALSVLARSNGVLNAGYIVQILFAGALCCLCICLPLFILQAYGYVNICHGRSTDELRPWCKARVPMVYNFIQSYYWGVGFLKYFKIKQLPNFLLAFPILSLAASSIIYYAKLRYVVILYYNIPTQLEIDYVIGESHKELSPNFSGPAAIIRIFGVTREVGHVAAQRRKQHAVSIGKERRDRLCEPSDFAEWELVVIVMFL